MQPPQRLLPIHAGHYATLVREDLNAFRSAINQDANIPNLVCESDGSSLLHLAASVGHIRYINFIVQVSPTLLYKTNSNSDLPVHVASRNGELEAVRTLISHSAAQPRNNADDEISMLEAKNMDGNTALHIALENQQEEMAKCLVEKCPQTFYKLNAQEISPLYLAIQAQFWELAKYMLSTHIVNQCPDAPNHLNLPEAKSVIHAAITAKNKDIFGMISNQYTEVVRYKTDERGMTPISYAAYTGFLDGVKYIFSNNRLQNQAFKIDENGLFPIHWACMGGNVDVVKEFISHFSVRAMLLVSKKGHNILHVAAASGKTVFVTAPKLVVD
ncbi:protein ACCELERATED CELL DEATH 6 [Beta vulgaris subsp. vulgaris]|uniref:protein ACCELERATED CELL DEATH 6 n=1 Tax=Beta vulgaris subsp. vulgaris TaxID=3555 RepID=UPI002547B74A|nr:protein ACCELERATED CELL DEATH 6 [Beta vulgaris subsp. vulgaris]